MSCRRHTSENIYFCLHVAKEKCSYLHYPCLYPLCDVASICILELFWLLHPFLPLEGEELCKMKAYVSLVSFLVQTKGCNYIPGIVVIIDYTRVQVVLWWLVFIIIITVLSFQQPTLESLEEHIFRSFQQCTLHKFSALCIYEHIHCCLIQTSA